MTDVVWGNIFKRRARESGVVDILQKIPVFEGLSRSDLVAVDRILHRRRFAAKEVIFHQDDAGVGMYIIQSGTVSIGMEPEGQQLVELRDGEFFGEIALLTEFPRSASAVAVTPCQLLFLSQTDLFDLLRRKPECGTRVLVQVAEIIGKRLVASNEVLRRLRGDLAAARAENERLRSSAAPKAEG
jgi:CRP/FNR family transcriptional regulator, cyclic AMP receptor protein